MAEIRAAAAHELDQVRGLFRDYAAWLQEDVCLQSFEQEIAGLPGAYGPPRGALLVAAQEDELVGCVALRELDPATAEMKRLFLRESSRGGGFGRSLVGAAVDHARELGYSRLRLDTLPKMGAAQKLYESLGFRDIARYNEIIAERVRFMELEL